MTYVKTSPRPAEITAILGSLTPRQREVLSLAAGGLTTAEIGSRLSLPTARVNAYLRAAWARLAGGVAPVAGDRSKRAGATSGVVTTETGRLRAAFGLSQERFARLVGTSPRTIARWEAAGSRTAPAAAAADRLAFLAEVRDLGIATFGANGFGQFVGSRQPLLEGRRVVEVLEGEQRGEVLDLLRGIAGGGPA